MLKESKELNKKALRVTQSLFVEFFYCFLAETRLARRLIFLAAVLACKAPLFFARAIFASASCNSVEVSSTAAPCSKAERTFFIAVLMDVLRAKFMVWRETSLRAFF